VFEKNRRDDRPKLISLGPLYLVDFEEFGALLGESDALFENISRISSKIANLSAVTANAFKRLS